MTADIVLATTQGILEIDGGRRELMTGKDVTSLATGADGVLWAIVGEHELCCIEGSTVETVAVADTPISCVQVHDGAVWCGTAGAHLLRFDGDRFEPVPSFDSAPTHDGWYTPWGGPPAVWSMAAAGESLYVSVHVGGILVTSDRGDHWSDTIDLHDDVHQVRVAPDGTLWAATGAGALTHGTDGGTTWTSLGTDLAERYLRSVALVDDGVIVGGSVGPRAPTSSLYKFFDDDGSVRRLGDGLPDHLGGNVDAYRLASNGSVVAVADPGGSVYWSTDGGAAWTTLVEDPPTVNAVLVR